MIQLLNLSFKYVWKESFFLDCHALQSRLIEYSIIMVYPELTIIVVGALCQGKERNDSIALPLGDFTTFLTDSTFQQIRTHPHKFNPYLPTFSLQQTFLHVCAPNL
ncbi:MAG: hypothetical protein K9G11_04755 [Rickettsiaceae bacterium]|nr:hypothetical protein [Rickettsiaceae bacterium]